MSNRYQPDRFVVSCKQSMNRVIHTWSSSHINKRAKTEGLIKFKQQPFANINESQWLIPWIQIVTGYSGKGIQAGINRLLFLPTSAAVYITLLANSHHLIKFISNDAYITLNLKQRQELCQCLIAASYNPTLAAKIFINETNNIKIKNTHTILYLEKICLITDRYRRDSLREGTLKGYGFIREINKEYGEWTKPSGLDRNIFKTMRKKFNIKKRVMKAEKNKHIDVVLPVFDESSFEFEDDSNDEMESDNDESGLQEFIHWKTKIFDYM
eukprot:281760_1